MLSTVMHNEALRIWFIIYFAFTLIGCERSGLAPGQYAPQIELKDLNGREYKLSDYRGKTVLLNFWATWCAPCVAEVPALNQLNSKLTGEKFVIISISEDTDPQALRDFVSKHSVTYPVLLDSQKVALTAYKVTGFPESFVIDRFGKLSLLPDFQTGDAFVRLVGPRDWAEPSMLQSLETIISK